ncbi:MAG: hypothetical protein O9262_09805, partial [Cyclobacteriaceae bacterium]|nr:hypothetical protein [Cyclobacteriaceae bacterium]
PPHTTSPHATTHKQPHPNTASLLNHMEAVKKEYEKVNITYTYKESTFEIVDGVMVIKDNSTTTIDITPENIANIGNAIKDVRNKIIN